MRKNFWLPSILLSALLLRLYHLTSLSLWHDEAFSALLIKYSWAEMMQRIALDVHPPFYYIVLRFWNYLFGNSLGSLRGFSLFFGTLSVLVLYRFVKKAFGSDKAALLSALLFAINAFQIQFVSQARMYTLGIFLILLAAYSLVMALQAEIAKKKGYYYVCFALASAASMLTHYYLLFSVAALCLFALFHHYYAFGFKLKKYLSLLAAYVLTAVAFLPWLPEFLVQYNRVGGGYWIPPMNIWSIPQTFWMMLTGLNINIDLTFSRVLVTLAFIFTAYFCTSFVQKTKSDFKWLVVFSLLMPFVGAVGFFILAKLRGAETSVYLIRYFIFASIFYTIALALWLETLKRETVKNILVAIYVGVCIYSIFTYWKDIDVKTKPGMKGVSNYLLGINKNDQIYVGSSSQYFSFTYYNKTGVKPQLYTPGIKSFEELPHYYGTALLTEKDITNYLPAKTGGSDNAWIIWTDGYYGKKPDVPANWAQISERGFGEINFYTPPYTIFVTKYKIN